MTIVMTELKSVEFKINESLHTVAYSKAVPRWLENWSIQNNFTPICSIVEVGSRTTLFMAAKDACVKLIARHVELLKSALPEYTKEDRPYMDDFEFVFVIHAAESGEPMKYIAHRYNLNF